jgi:anti-anti-sigma regulatory factor
MISSLVQEAVDSLEEGLQILSPEWRYLHVNPVAARQGRKPAAELIGKTMLECYPGIDQTSMFAVLERCMRERATYTLENEFTYEDGAHAWFELRVRPCPAGLVILSLDTTEQRTMQARLEAAYKQALRDVVLPVIRVHDGVLLVPIVGALDAARAGSVTETVLARVVADQARVVIFEVAGLPTLDTQVAQALLEATAMIRLLGASTILTGISPSAAKTIVELGVDLSSMQTTSQLSEGLELALARVGRVEIRAKKQA